MAEGLSVLEPHQEAYEGLQHATTAAKRTAALARQMLAYAGRGAVMREVGDIDELVDETVGLARVAIRNDVRLHFTAGSRRDITADLTQIRQLVMNLITNAAQAIGDGGSGEVHVSVEVERLAATDGDDALAGRVTEGPYVCLEVADDGCGMSASTVDRVFDPFFTTKAMGHGLGMSAVLGIIRGHDGAIWVKTELGQGTTFRVAFPLEVQPVVNVVRPASQPGVVLVADDERVIRRLARVTLERAGFEVLEACDGVEAVSVFRANADRVGVVLLDSMMPNLAGAEVLSKIRTMRPEQPVVVSSGYTREADVPAGERPTAYLPKPWRAEELVRVIQGAVQRGASK